MIRYALQWRQPGDSVLLQDHEILRKAAEHVRLLQAEPPAPRWAEYDRWIAPARRDRRANGVVVAAAAAEEERALAVELDIANGGGGNVGDLSADDDRGEAPAAIDPDGVEAVIDLPDDAAIAAASDDAKRRQTLHGDYLRLHLAMLNPRTLAAEPGPAGSERKASHAYAKKRFAAQVAKFGLPTLRINAGVWYGGVLRARGIAACLRLVSVVNSHAIVNHIQADAIPGIDVYATILHPLHCLPAGALICVPWLIVHTELISMSDGIVG